MGESQEDRSNLFYKRIRHLADEDKELTSLQIKAILQTWFPIKNGMGWTWDESVKKYVLE